MHSITALSPGVPKSTHQQTQFAGRHPGVMAAGLLMTIGGTIGLALPTHAQKAGDTFAKEAKVASSASESRAGMQLAKAVDTLDTHIVNIAQKQSQKPPYSAGVHTEPAVLLQDAIREGSLTQAQLNKFIAEAKNLKPTQQDTKKLYDSMFDELIKPRIKAPKQQVLAKRQANDFFKAWDHANGFRDSSGIKGNLNTLSIVVIMLGLITAFGSTLDIEWGTILD